MANIYGSDNDDILVGTDEDDSILSQGGVDTVTGGDGNDTFELRGWGNNKFGTLTITDFTAGDGAEDRIDLDGHSWELSGVQIARDFDEILDVTTQVGTDTHIALTGDYTIILQNVDRNDLVAEDFQNYYPNRIGTEGDDILTGVGGYETFYGYGGNDIITASHGHATIYGGDGDDTITGSGGGDALIDGGAGDDTITGQGGPDKITGGTGDDTINAGGGNDTINGGEGNDTLSGGHGNNTFIVSANSGHDTISDFTAGSDILDLTTIFSGSFNDLLNLAVDTADGVRIATGADAIAFVVEQGESLSSTERLLNNSGSTASVTLNGVSKSELVEASFPDLSLLPLDLVGTDGDDVLTGKNGDDNISGGDGDDILTGAGGNDHINGGSGKNTINGGDGHDYISTGNDDDIINGGAGNDTIFAYGGNDTVTGGTGNDTFELRGWGDNKFGTLTITDFTARNGSEDRIDLDGFSWEHSGIQIARNFGELLEVTMQVGGDTHIALSGDYTIILQNTHKSDLIADDFVNYHADRIGTAGDDILHDTGAGGGTFLGFGGNDTVLGSANSDTIDGGAGNDTLNGNGGSDSINGGDGNDVIDGGSGSDILDGGAGNDTLIGGFGDDTFQFIDNAGSSGPGSMFSGTFGFDTIQGFVAGEGTEDRLDLSLFEVGSFYDLMLNPNNVDGDVVIDVATVSGTSTITLEGVSKDQLHADDFIGLSEETPGLTFIGDDADDTLDGSEGDDVMEGHGGNDTFKGLGDDTIIGGDGADSLLGGTGDDTLDGDAGNDWMRGEDGDDTLNGGTGRDRLFGEAGNDRLDGGTNNDVLTGGTGNDTYVVDHTSDQVVEQDGEGTDTVESTIDYTLGDHVENLTLTGMDAINATGNAADNAIVGNKANNVIDGGAGDDALTGGSGRDTFVFSAGYLNSSLAVFCKIFATGRHVYKCITKSA